MPRLDPARLAADVVDLLTRALAPVLARLAGLEASATAFDARAAALEARSDQAAAVAAVTTAIGGLGDRLAALEARPPLRGPAGDRGADGVGFADPAIAYDGQRTFTFCFADGRFTVITPPLAIYQGVYLPARAYAVGDLVTDRGNLWHCNTPTTTPPGRDVGAWTLVVRRGKDARPKATP